MPLLFAGAYNGKYFKRLNEQRAAKEILKNCEKYEVSRTKSSALYFTGEDKEYARAAEGMIKTYLPLLAEDIGLKENPFVTLVIFPSREEMYSSIGYAPVSAQKGGEPYPMGAYTAGVLTVLSPNCWAEGVTLDTFISSGPVIHELAHFVLDTKTNGNYQEWFSEGAALWYENKYTGYEWGENTSGKAVTYAELSGGFRRLSEKESYRKSYVIVNYIVESKGEKALRYIYGRLEKGKSLDGVLRNLLGKGFEVLDGLS